MATDHGIEGSERVDLRAMTCLRRPCRPSLAIPPGRSAHPRTPRINHQGVGVRPETFRNPETTPGTVCSTASEWRELLPPDVAYAVSVRGRLRRAAGQLVVPWER